MVGTRHWAPAAGRLPPALRRCVVLVAAAASILGGCRSGAAPDSARESGGVVALGGLLLPVATYNGARLSAGAAASEAMGPFRPILAPVAISAQGADIFFADAALEGVFRLDTTLLSMQRLGAYRARPGIRLHALGDSTLYVLDPDMRELARLSREGRVLERYRDPQTLSGVGAMTVDPVTGSILLADRGQNRVLSVSRTLAATVPILVQRTEGLVLENVWALAAGRDALYVIDRSRRQIVRLDLQGRLLQNFGADVLKLPSAIAVDRYRRVFVADDGERALHVFRNGKLVGTLSAAALGVDGIADLAITESELVLAGGGATGIRVFRLLPPREDS